MNDVRMMQLLVILFGCISKAEFDSAADFDFPFGQQKRLISLIFKNVSKSID